MEPQLEQRLHEIGGNCGLAVDALECELADAPGANRLCESPQSVDAAVKPTREKRK